MMEVSMDENTLIKIIREVVKEELNTFKQDVATKEDLKAFATKEDFGNFLLRFDARMKQFQEVFS
jgi:hypothetical protein